MMTFEDTMRWGAAQYADVLAELSARGLPAEFTQTGGMCAALVVTLEAGHSLLITDAEDSLAWARAEHQGWSVGLYDDNEGSDHEGALAFGQVDESSTDALLALLADVMRAGAGARGAGV